MPLNLPSFLTKGSKTKLAPIVSSARAAKLICEKWLANYKYVPDAIVVEGPKAGGHLGYKPEQITDEHFALERLLPKSFRKFVVSARRTTRTSRSSQQAASTRAKTFIASWSWAPTVSDGQALRHHGGVRRLDGVQAELHRSLSTGHRDHQSPVGMPGRAIHNSFLERVKQGLKQPKSCPFNCIKTCDVTHSPYCIIMALYNAFKGNLSAGYAFAGVNAWRAERSRCERADDEPYRRIRPFQPEKQLAKLKNNVR